MSELGLPNLGFLADHPCYYNIQLETDTPLRLEEFDNLKIEW